MLPTPLLTIWSDTSPPVSISFRLSITEVSEPCTSAFTITLKSSASCFWVISFRRSAPVTLALAAFCSRSIRTAVALARASFSFFCTSKISPNCGSSLNPVMVTGVDGPASLIALPVKSCNVRTLPYAVPATKKCPGFSIPCSTSRLTTAPRPVSMCASITNPSAGVWISALSSSISATRSTISSSLSMFWPVFALTSTIITSPPHSSGLRLCSLASCAFTICGLAASLSILLIATTIFALAVRAKRIASIVCGFTPSSAATTITTTSVRVAPC